MFLGRPDRKEQAVMDTTEMIDPVTGEIIDEQQLAEQLLRQSKEQGVDLLGPDGLLNGLTKRVLESALEAELSEHLGHEKHQPSEGGNVRNGTRAKTVLTEVGPVEISVPRDRAGSFEPKIVKKRQRRLTGVDEIVLSLTARGLTTGAHFDDVYGAQVSKDTISRITDKVIEEMTDWQNRPLDRGRFQGVVANRGCCWVPSSHELGRGAIVEHEAGPGVQQVGDLGNAAGWYLVEVRAFREDWRTSPFAFSLLPRCQGECGSAK